MSDGTNIADLVYAKFDRVVNEMRDSLVQGGRDPNVVLEADRDRLKVRLLVNPAPSPEWLAYVFEPQQLVGPIEPWQLASWIIASWLELSGQIRPENADGRGFKREQS